MPNILPAGKAGSMVANHVPGIDGRWSDGFSDLRVHSLHGYFLRPGDPKVPTVIRVGRARDGRSFATRRILVTQRGEAIFNMDASFQLVGSGLSHQADMPDLQPPAEEKIPAALYDAAFVTWRHEFRRLRSESPQPPEQFVWFKPTGPVPRGDLIAACFGLNQTMC